MCSYLSIGCDKNAFSAHPVGVTHPVVEGEGVRLRPTTPADLPTAARLFRDPGFYERWGGAPKTDEEITQKYLGERSPRVECFFVEVDEDVVGFTQYHDADDGGEGGGMDLVLLPASRGRGIGTAVVHALVRFVGEQKGWRRFTVDPDVDNERGVNFWKKAGFVPQRIVEDDGGRPPYWLLLWPMAE